MKYNREEDSLGITHSQSQLNYYHQRIHDSIAIMSYWCLLSLHCILSKSSLSFNLMINEVTFKTRLVFEGVSEFERNWQVVRFQKSHFLPSPLKSFIIWPSDSLMQFHYLFLSSMKNTIQDLAHHGIQSFLCHWNLMLSNQFTQKFLELYSTSSKGYQGSKRCLIFLEFF